MSKAKLIRKYAGREPGSEVEGSEVEINGLVVLGLAQRVDDAAEASNEAEAEELPAIPLNPPPVAEPDEAHEER